MPKGIDKARHITARLAEYQTSGREIQVLLVDPCSGIFLEVTCIGSGHKEHIPTLGETSPKIERTGAQIYVASLCELDVY